MRIISGKLKGIRIHPPQNLPVRPTTDLSKESLFNILTNLVDFEELSILDLFAGTGNMSYEFYSRGSQDITTVERNFHCIKFVQQTVEKHKMDSLKIVKSDVFKFLESTKKKFDLIFADPPYDLDKQLEIPKIVFNRDLLQEDGYLIIEHSTLKKMDNLPNFAYQRIYGQSSFSFFRKQNL